MYPHEALILTFAQNRTANLDAQTEDGVYKQFDSASDKNFEDNMRIVTQNVMEIDDYMRHVWQILLCADQEIFHNESPFLMQWRQLHERFRFALRQSRDLSIRLARKIRVFYQDVLPLFEAENGDIPVEVKVEAFRRFADADDAAGVNRSMIEDQEACEKLGRDFDDLRIDIASFAGSLEGSLRRSDEDFESRIRDLKRSMQQVDEAFRRSQNPVGLVTLSPRFC
ncbi:hypothetical protein BT96DRAFT_144581 [Gymnopus androsaceus JB14]|uniref:Uncharacterized protein n=1 Tax=Gymnopus androsaceus JB14 TaxID=1447944 RepID=A0A6A4HB14_9AGAR|nr:hypothetical protein BT96DRAFT_144581 [Gymnopus androsaceus JB14]